MATWTSEQMEAEIKRLRAEAEAAIGSLRKTVEDLKKKNSTWSITDKRAFTNVPEYGGDVEEYEDWNFKMETFFCTEPGWATVFKALKAELVIPKKEGLGAILIDVQLNNSGCEPDKMNRELYQALCHKTKGKALKVVKNQDSYDEYNGLMAWWKLGNEKNSMTAQRMQGLAQKV